MKIKKDLVIAVLTTFCLVATLFMILPIRSDPYDAWRDIDDDGDVDIKDIRLHDKIIRHDGRSNKERDCD